MAYPARKPGKNVRNSHGHIGIGAQFDIENGGRRVRDISQEEKPPIATRCPGSTAAFNTISNVEKPFVTKKISKCPCIPPTLTRVLLRRTSFAGQCGWRLKLGFMSGRSRLTEFDQEASRKPSFR